MDLNLVTLSSSKVPPLLVIDDALFPVMVKDILGRAQLDVCLLCGPTDSPFSRID